MRGRIPIINFEECYDSLELLGRGSFATVFKIQDKISKEFYAGKFYFKINFDQSKNR